MGPLLVLRVRSSVSAVRFEVVVVGQVLGDIVVRRCKHARVVAAVSWHFLVVSGVLLLEVVLLLSVTD